MNSRIRVLVLCFWLFFPAVRPILCCCVHIFDATVTPPSFASMAHHLRSATATSSAEIQTRQAFAIRFSREVAPRPHHSSALGHDWALGSTHPSPPPWKQHRTSSPKPPLWETHSLHDARGPRANHHHLRRRCLSRCHPTLFGRGQPRMSARPCLL
jgi:hypothetical protein